MKTLPKTLQNIWPKHKSLAVINRTLIFFGTILSVSCNMGSTDEKFVGEWCYCKPNDSTIDNNESNNQRNCIASIKKVESTTESYSFHMAFIFSITETFTKKDDNTLMSVDGTRDELDYINSNQHVVLISNDGHRMEFSRLK